MAIVKELLRTEEDGRLSFGDYTLASKTKLDNFEFEGDLYKVKTFSEITKLEKNGMFVYESVPGSAVENFKQIQRSLFRFLHRRMYSLHWNLSRRVNTKCFWMVFQPER